jgi:hypothetical protein
MFPRKRFPVLALAFVLSISTLAALSFARTERGPFAPFVPQAPPERALGDFDGDGRMDTALVQDRAGDRHISIQLSRSASIIRLDASVIGVIESDVDHDGDLDLVAATPSGDVLIWLNDGYGRFTRQAASTNARDLSGALVLVQTVWPESMAVGIRAPFVASPAQGHAIFLLTKARPPTTLVAFDSPTPILPPLRAPPTLST